MKFNLKTVITVFSISLGLGQAHAVTNEICTDQSGRIKIVIQKDLNDEINQIELYEHTQLRATDTGPFAANYCHVNGAIYVGSTFSYGGCFQSGQKEAKLLSWDKFFRSSFKRNLEQITVNLNTFNCIKE